MESETSTENEETPELKVTEAAGRKVWEFGVDLDDVKCTGSGRCILVNDVETAAG